MIDAPRPLDGLRFGSPGFGDVGGRVGKRFAGFKGTLLVLGADLADGVVPAIVPTNASFVVDNRPGAVGRPDGLAGGAVAIQSDVEGSAVAFADLPFSDKAVGAGNGSSAGRSLEFNALDVGHGVSLLASVFEDDNDRVPAGGGRSQQARRNGQQQR